MLSPNVSSQLDTAGPIMLDEAKVRVAHLANARARGRPDSGIECAIVRRMPEQPAAVGVDQSDRTVGERIGYARNFRGRGAVDREFDLTRHLCCYVDQPLIIAQHL